MAKKNKRVYMYGAPSKKTSRSPGFKAGWYSKSRSSHEQDEKIRKQAGTLKAIMIGTPNQKLIEPKYKKLRKPPKDKNIKEKAMKKPGTWN